VPADPKKGASFPLPERIVRRFGQFHLFDNTWGLPYPWRPEDLRSSRMTVTIADVAPGEILLRLEGEALIATAAEASQAARGYDAKVLGHLRFDRARKAFTRFDGVILGDHWDNDGSGAGRTGRHPLGIAFELAKGDSPQDRVPPETTRGGRLSQYLGEGGRVTSFAGSGRSGRSPTRRLSSPST